MYWLKWHNFRGNSRLLLLTGALVASAFFVAHKAQAYVPILEQTQDSYLAHGAWDQDKVIQYFHSDSATPISAVQVKVANAGIDPNCNVVNGWQMRLYISPYYSVVSNEKFYFADSTPTIYTFTFPDKVPANQVIDFQIESLDYYCQQPYWPIQNLVFAGALGDPYPDHPALFFHDSSGQFSNTLTDYDMWFRILADGEPTKTPVLIIPGVLGTEIVKGNDLLWANVEKMIIGNDQFLDPLSFNLDLSSSDNSLSLLGVIKKKVFGTFSLDYTQGLINEFVGQGYIEGENIFTFPYDWRFGVSQESINQLKGQIDYILSQTDSGKLAGKVDVIAHSTGGLLLKQYIIEHPLDHGVNKAIMVGVPNLGAPKAIKVLLQGDNFGIPVLNDEEMKKLGQNMPVIYDLSPSQEYFELGGSYFKSINTGTKEIHDLNFEQTDSFLVSHMLGNSIGINNSKNLHTTEFDNFDLRNAGVDLYNIVGCQNGTFDKATYTYGPYITPSVNTTSLANGDGTVPVISATSISTGNDHKIYARKIKHADLMSANNIRQEIVNLIMGSESLSVDKNTVFPQTTLDQSPGKCGLKGHWWQIFSPVSIKITDQIGNTAQLLDDGSIQNNIPGSDFEIFGDHKFVYIPTDEGENYSVSLVGIGQGNFTFKDYEITNDKVDDIKIYSNIPVTTNSIGQVIMADNKITLVFDNKIITPSIVATSEPNPEFEIQFDPNNKDLKFTGVDSSNLVIDSGSQVNLYDNFGNFTELSFREKDRKAALAANLVNISYNSNASVFDKNKMSFSWKLDPNGQINTLTQIIQSIDGYNVKAVYSKGSTLVTGYDSNGKININKSGLILLKVQTNQGNLSWSLITN